jgi:hypothetical protein
VRNAWSGAVGWQSRRSRSSTASGRPTRSLRTPVAARLLPASGEIIAGNSAPSGLTNWITERELGKHLRDQNLIRPLASPRLLELEGGDLRFLSTVDVSGQPAQVSTEFQRRLAELTWEQTKIAVELSCGGVRTRRRLFQRALPRGDQGARRRTVCVLRIPRTQSRGTPSAPAPPASGGRARAGLVGSRRRTPAAAALMINA